MLKAITVTLTTHTNNNITIDKVSFEPQVRDMGTPNIGKHKRCMGVPWHSHGDDIFYGIGDLIGIGVKDFEEDTNGE
jgi:hypothetical protein